MAESNKNQQPNRPANEAGSPATPGHRLVKERVIENGRDEQDIPRPTDENLSGTPVGSDPRE